MSKTLRCNFSYFDELEKFRTMSIGITSAQREKVLEIINPDAYKELIQYRKDADKHFKDEVIEQLNIVIDKLYLVDPKIIQELLYIKYLIFK